MRVIAASPALLAADRGAARATTLQESRQRFNVATLTGFGDAGNWSRLEGDARRDRRSRDDLAQNASRDAIMALMLGQLYEALRAGNVPDEKARAAAEEVANYEGELTKLRLELGERFRDTGERIGRVEGDLRLLKWMTGFMIAAVLGVFAIQWQILLRLPS
jgi:hypothetical protein